MMENADERIFVVQTLLFDKTISGLARSGSSGLGSLKSNIFMYLNI